MEWYTKEWGRNLLKVVKQDEQAEFCTIWQRLFRDSGAENQTLSSMSPGSILLCAGLVTIHSVSMTLFIVLMVYFFCLLSYKWNVRMLWKVFSGIPDWNRLTAPQRFTFAEFSGSESTGSGIQESEGISTKSLWISLPAGNSLTVWFIYIHIFISKFDDSHLLTMRFMEWT